VYGSNIFAGSSFSGVFLSSNNGASWTKINSGLKYMNVNSLSVCGSNIFVGTNIGGVLLSTDNGTSWNAVDSGLMNMEVRSVTVSDGYIFAGTWGSSVWRRPLSEMVGVTNPDRQPKMIHQENLRVSSSIQTNHSAIIVFSLPHSDRVTIKIYNLSGHEITTLFDKNIESGSHTLTWDTKNIPAGCYTVRMQVGEKMFVKSVPVFR
jgi:hypothetical protein